jgi:hypothetical protein
VLQAYDGIAPPSETGGPIAITIEQMLLKKLSHCAFPDKPMSDLRMAIPKFSG